MHGTEFVESITHEETSNLLEQLTQELKTITNTMQALWKTMQGEQTPVLSEAAIDHVRTLYLLNQMQEMIKDKIQIISQN